MYRATETGEGNYYFIGLEIKQFFYTLKENIFQLGKTSSLTQNTNSPLDNDTCSSNTDSTDDDYTGMFNKPSNTNQVMPPSSVLPLPVLLPSPVLPPPLPASLSSMDTIKIPQQVENELKNSETTISSDMEDITGSDYQTLIDLTRNTNTLYEVNNKECTLHNI